MEDEEKRDLANSIIGKEKPESEEQAEADVPETAEALLQRIGGDIKAYLDRGKAGEPPKA